MKFKEIYSRYRKNFCHFIELISIFIHIEKDSPGMIESVSENAFGAVSMFFYNCLFFIFINFTGKIKLSPRCWAVCLFFQAL